MDYVDRMLLKNGWKQVNREFTEFKADVLESGKNGKCKDLSDFDKDRILMASLLGQSFFKTAGRVEYFCYAVRT